MVPELMRLFDRTLVILLIAALLALLSVAPALAGIANSNPRDRGPAHMVYRGESDANDMTIRVNRLEHTFTVRDKAGAQAGLNCVQYGPNHVECDRFDSPALGEQIYVYLGESADRVRVLANRGATVHGGAGPDEIIGSEGASGQDRLFGGPGDDRIDASGDGADAKINCGPGIDRVIVDRADPRPTHCERVSVRRR